MLSEDEKDTVERILNNVGLAKRLILDGDSKAALRFMDRALSWSDRILGKTHPMYDPNNT